MNPAWKRWSFVVGIALAATVLYGRHGWNGEDDGFVVGLAWRVVNGEWPYRDFIYVRPPLTPWLHALPLLVWPDAGQVLFTRFLFFLSLAASTELAVVELHVAAAASAPRVSPRAIALLAFAIASAGFPPMPWHTVDGVLLGAAGLVALSRSRGIPGLVLGATLVMGAAATKQSFFFLVPFALAQVAWSRGRRDLTVVAMTCVTLAAAAVGILAWVGLLGSCYMQLRAATRGASLFGAGVVSYLKPFVLYALPAVVIVAVLDRSLSAVFGRKIDRSWIPYGLVGGVLALAIARVLVERRFQPPLGNYPALLWIAVALGLAVDRELPRRAGALLGACLGLAWCASLSWGYQTPVLFAAPLAWGVIWISRHRFGTNPRRLLLLLVPLALTLQATAYGFPYRDAPRSQLTHDLGTVFDKLRGVRGSEAALARLRELSRLQQRFGDRFAVLPSMPAAHFLTGTRPVLPIDWPIENETAGRTAQIEQDLAASGAVVFLDRDSRAICVGSGACCELAVRVRDSWELAERGAIFDVFRPRTGPK